MPHGFDLERGLHDRLRGEVPRPALDWVEVRTGRRVVGARALEGGQAAALHRLRFDDGAADLVLRRYVLDWVEEEPWAPANEAAILAHLTGTTIPAPALVAVDPAGAQTGAPAVLMTALPGEVVWHPGDLDGWLDALVRTVVAIQRVPTSPALRAWEAYPPEGIPAATRHRWAWERAVAAVAEPRPAFAPVFLHRDFHPGNVLWASDRLTGVVDWTSSCVGPAEEDVAHCRVNLAVSHGQAVADDFLERWLAATRRSTYDPRWDLLDVASMGGRDDVDPGLDAFVAAAARRCTAHSR